MQPAGLGILFLAIVVAVLVGIFLWSRSQQEKRFESFFKAISFDLLKNNQQAWEGESREKIQAVVNPLKEALSRHEELLNKLEKERVSAYVGLKSEIGQLMTAHQALQKETSSLSTALRNPQVAGSWGEFTLRRAVELSGLSEHCDFEEQVSVSGTDGRVRPDMVVHLPSNRHLIVDAKVSLDAYLEAVGAPNNEARTTGLKKHASVMREHLKKLSAKSYWMQFENSPDFVVMFVPGESFLSAALDQDRALLEDGFQKNVLLATPTTLIALLRVAAQGWREAAMAENAKALSRLGKELQERIAKWMEHLGDVGDSLNKAVKSYNNAIGSLESRVLPAARKLGELSGPDVKSLPPIESIDQAVRVTVQTASD